jgi:hypothetical protein
MGKAAMQPASWRTRCIAPQDEEGVMRRVMAILIPVTLAIGAASCASTGTVSDLDKRLAAIESKLDGIDQRLSQTATRLDQVERTSQMSAQKADAAAAQARSAAERAEQASQRADAVFRTSVSK